MRLLRSFNGLPDLGEQAFLVGAQGAFEDQEIRGVVAAEYRALEFERGQELLHLDEQFGLVKRLPFGKVGTKALFAGGEADDQRR